MYRVGRLSGIGEPDVGMLHNLTKALPANRFRSETVPWNNQFGPVPVWNGAAYDKNIGAGIATGLSWINSVIAAGDVPVLTGYSGGAELACRIAEVAGDKLKGLVVAANPLRAVNDSNAPHYGISGAHGRFGSKTKFIDVANPADVIPCCPRTSPLRDFDDLARHFSLADPGAWGPAVMEAAKRGRLQNAWRLNDLPQWFLAVAYLRGYMYDGQHTAYYVPRLPAVAAQLAAIMP